jgi:hypothetical protein
MHRHKPSRLPPSQASFAPLRPFPGTIAVGPDPKEPKEKAGPPIHDAKGRSSTLRPWKNGSNMDVNELQAGSILYVPVFQKGGLIWTGDSHCLQVGGEVNLTALECSYKSIEIKPIVRKDLHIEWPRAETSHALGLHGLRRGFKRSHENCGAPNREFSGGTKKWCPCRAKKLTHLRPLSRRAGGNQTWARWSHYFVKSDLRRARRRVTTLSTRSISLALMQTN